MIRNFVLVLIIAVLWPVLSLAGDNPKFDKLCKNILEGIQSFQPVKATEMGIHAYDNRLADYSSKSVKKFIKQLTSYEKKLYKYKNKKLSAHDRLNYKLIKSNVDILLQDFKKIRWHKRSPQLYVEEAVNGIYSLMLSQHAPLSEKVVLLISRFRAMPALFASARRNIKKPPPIYKDAAQESLESGQQFFKQVAGQLMNQFPERADVILKVSTAAREAMNDFSIFLSELSDGSETSYAIGKNNLDYKLSNQFFLTFDSDSLLKIGEQLLADAAIAYNEFKELVENNHQNGRDSVFTPAAFSKRDIIDYYNWETNQVKVFLEKNEIISVPEILAPLTVVETPSFLQPMIRGIAYQPAGPFNENQSSLFYVRPIPDDLDREQLEARYRYVHRRGFKGSVVHEAFPGHHLQMQIAGANPDPVRKWQTNLMMIEGWALYCEEMMYEAGLYGDEDPGQRLGILGGIRFRAARIVVDVKLHTNQFTYRQAVDFMIDTLDIDSESGRQYIQTEVRKYTLRPTKPMSYLMGKREIKRLLAAVKEKEGSEFSLINFHDRLLAEGSVPPVLLKRVLGL